MLVPGPPDLQQLALVVFFIPATSANTLPALVVVTLCNLRWWYIYIYILAEKPAFGGLLCAGVPAKESRGWPGDASVSDVDVCMQFTWKITAAKQITDSCKK